MKYFLFAYLLILPSSILAKKIGCDNLQRIGNYLTMRGQDFIQAYKNHKLAGHADELRQSVGDVNKARAMAYNFPPLRDLGFPPVGKDWEPFIVTMEKSSLYGKRSGWRYKNANGDIATIRLDYDPVKGGHYNIDVMKKLPTGKESYKISFEFNCNGKNCSPEQIQKLAESLN